MLNPFPEFLVYAFFAPTVLRVAVAIAFLYSAYYTYTHRKHIAEVAFPVIGKASWLGVGSTVVHGVLAFMLGAGYNTQVAAILGMLGALKGMLLSRRYPGIFPFARATYALIFIILFSLLLTGAGALAYDLPL
jgi:hypothetical protein